MTSPGGGVDAAVLLPCPFCGGADDQFVTSVSGRYWIVSPCACNDVCGPTARSEAEAIAAWNRRVVPAQGAEPDGLCSLIRSVLTQGHAQQADYAMGKYPLGYEQFCAHFEQAARDRVPQFLALCSVAAPAAPVSGSVAELLREARDTLRAIHDTGALHYDADCDCTSCVPKAGACALLAKLDAALSGPVAGGDSRGEPVALQELYDTITANALNRRDLEGDFGASYEFDVLWNCYHAVWGALVRATAALQKAHDQTPLCWVRPSDIEFLNQGEPDVADPAEIELSPMADASGGLTMPLYASPPQMEKPDGAASVSSKTVTSSLSGGASVANPVLLRKETDIQSALTLFDAWEDRPGWEKRIVAGKILAAEVRYLRTLLQAHRSAPAAPSKVGEPGRLLAHAEHHLSKRDQNPELALMYVRDAIAALRAVGVAGQKDGGVE